GPGARHRPAGRGRGRPGDRGRDRGPDRAADGGRHLERARHQAAGPGAGGGRARAGARHRGGGAAPGAAGTRIPPAPRRLRGAARRAGGREVSRPDGGEAGRAAGGIFRADLLQGRVALVTGGGTGIGLGIASCLAAAGATVAIASRKPEHLEPAAAELRAQGARVTTVEANVREPEAVARMVAQVTEAHGRLDILVNNAAGNFYAPSAGLSPNAWRAVIETDLYGSFYCAQAVHPVMKAQGGGRIVSISMTLHYRGWPLMAHATA